MDEHLISAVKDLRKSACVLSLIVENSARIIKDELFLERSFEALSNEVERIKKVISLVKSARDIKTFDLKKLESVEKLSKKDAKMNLQATYKKEANGSIRATIKVIDSGDFPTVNIFNSASKNPSDEAWNLGEGKQSSISKTLPNSDEAKQWVLSQVKVLREKLDHWRNIVVPESEEFEV